MTEINTLIKDMQATLTPSVGGGVSPEVLKNFGERVAKHADMTLKFEEARVREPKVLYASEVGEKCVRKLYYKLNNTVGEDLSPSTHFKFLYGDILEETILLVAEAAGHRVEDMQRKVVLELENGWQIRGRLDAIIDGVPIDVKSMSSFGFDKLPLDLAHYDDPFGYIDQVSFYRNFGGYDSEQVGILSVDKQLGHIKLATGTGTARDTQRATLTRNTKLLESVSSLPPKAFGAVPEGKSGNMKLATACSYCAFKQACWPGLRTFVYSKGPVFLTEVVNEPKVPEVL